MKTKKQEFIDKYLIIYLHEKWIDGTYEKAIKSLESVINEAISEHEDAKWHHDKQFPVQGEILVESEYGFYIADIGKSCLDNIIRWQKLPSPYVKGGAK